ncbi:MAG: hypothetical protein A3J79_08100 [Elusimicrobia bacterium RIFOXYB2_FULL_62_6]|nr:MAG: hypothetical protein A3J79_08100 [Elusimicrobia bacterium RIFOXYB2_FULL_62_6]
MTNCTAHFRAAARRTFLKRLAAAGLLFFSAAAAQGGGAAGIRLEEEELAITGEDGAVSSLFVSKHGPEKQAALDGVKARLLRKLELKDEAELLRKNLQGVYAEESARMLKITKLVSPRLRFYDAAGKIIKELDVGVAVSSTEKTGPGGQRARFTRSNIRHASVSADGRLALLTEDRAELSPVKAGSGKATFFAADGAALWEKEYPEFRSVVGEISGNGRKAFLFEFWRTDLSPLPEKEVKNQFSVYGKNGKRLLTYPKNRKQEGGRLIAGEFKASPDGKYAAVRSVDAGQRQLGWLVFDTDSGSFWFLEDKELVVDGLSDSGSCRVSLASGAGARTIDLGKQAFLPLK